MCLQNATQNNIHYLKQRQAATWEISNRVEFWCEFVRLNASTFPNKTRSPAVARIANRTGCQWPSTDGQTDDNHDNSSTVTKVQSAKKALTCEAVDRCVCSTVVGGRCRPVWMFWSAHCHYYWLLMLLLMCHCLYVTSSSRVDRGVVNAVRCSARLLPPYHCTSPAQPTQRTQRNARIARIVDKQVYLTEKTV